MFWVQWKSHSPKISFVFSGGLNTLIGYENDEFWGRQASYIQNLFEIRPFPKYEFSLSRGKFRQFSLLMQLDAGRVSGAPDIPDIRVQDQNGNLV